MWRVMSRVAGLVDIQSSKKASSLEGALVVKKMAHFPPRKACVAESDG